MSTLSDYATTDLQKDIARLESEGYSAEEIGALIDASSSTVRKTLHRLRVKAEAAPAIEGMRVVKASVLTDLDGNERLRWTKYADEAANDGPEDIAAALIAGLAGVEPVAPYELPVAGCGEGLMNVHVIADLHLGMFADRTETRDRDWSTRKGELTLARYILSSCAAAPRAERGVLLFLGDELHFDGMDAVTPAHKHLLDADVRFPKLVEIATRAIAAAIEHMRGHYPQLDVVFCSGNHNPASAAWLRTMFNHVYRDEPRVSVDMSAHSMQMIEHGKTMLVATHGDKIKMANVDRVAAANFPKAFGNTVHRYGHMGHRHHRDVIETPLMIVEQHATLAAKDAHSALNGYSSQSAAETICYCAEHGEVSRVRFTAGFLGAKVA